MKIIVASSTQDFYRMAASVIADRICSKPDMVLGLSTGRTTGGIHQAVVDIHNVNDFDVSRLKVFGLDEVTGVDQNYAGACWEMLRSEFVDPIGVSRNNYLMLPTHSNDFKKACEGFISRLKSWGGIDLLVLGLGENGHLGFNQPGTPFETGAHTGLMDQRLEARIRRETNSPAEHPLGGVTIGIRDIMHSHSIMLVANGKNKTSIVRQMFEEPITPELPATILRLHPDCTFLLDAEAAREIDVDKLREIF